MYSQRIAHCRVDEERICTGRGAVALIDVRMTADRLISSAGVCHVESFDISGRSAMREIGISRCVETVSRDMNGRNSKANVSLPT